MVSSLLGSLTLQDTGSHLFTQNSVYYQNIEVDNPAVFDPKHRFIPYYMAGLAYYRLDSHFRSKVIDAKYRRIKFFLLMLFRMLAETESLALKHMSSDRLTSKYCQPIIDILNDKEKSLNLFQETTKIWELSCIDIDDKQLLKQASVTKRLIETYKKQF
jgi:hypothetical protein